MEIILYLIFWNLALALLSRLAEDRFRPALRWAAPLSVLLLPVQTPGQRLAATSLCLLFALKACLLLGRSRATVAQMDPKGLLLYFSLWPGLDPTPLERTVPGTPFPARWFVQGWVTMIVSGVAIGWLALHQHLSGGWMLVGILGFVHLGYSDVLSACMRLMGFPVERLFDNPLASQGLRDFWSRRWNRPFVEMNRLLFIPLLRKLGLTGAQAIFGGFLVSGLLHEVAISFPAGGGWGGPLSYFVLQGVMMRLEGDWLRGGPTWVRRLWTWGWLLLPLPWLFHPAFVRELLAPLAGTVSSWSVFESQQSLYRFLLTASGWGHFLVLGAGLQVPWRLGWHQELTRLRPLNRKLLWVYYGYIGCFIVTFGAVILRLREEMLGGDPAARILLTIIATFWTARIVIDALVFEHDDWPEGVLFIIGHTLLTSLFLFIALSGWLVLGA